MSEPGAGDTPPSVPPEVAPGPPAQPEAAPALDPALAPERPVSALPMLVEAPGRYSKRFVGVYAVLGTILAASVAGLVILVIRPAHQGTPAWSPDSWKPTSSSASKVTSEIADHIGHRYRLSENGGQLVALIAQKPPAVTSGTTNIAIKYVAVRKAPQSNTGIAVYPTDKTVNYTLCGLGAHCSIAKGQPTETRGRLVRREALEAALYTFKFAPSIDSIAAFMPPPPGQTTSSVLYIRKDDVKDQLHKPLTDTLPLRTPPLPSAPDNVEQSTIDKLTLTHMFTYELQALPTGGAVLILDPAT